MPKIQILSPEIRGKIAAGEVIERPASVIKELLENAFDAGASRIKVEFTKGGLERIAVYDDGEGMSPEDLRLCYLPFATSKITSVEDLLKLSSYGFRGEALHSIAQVSELRIISKSKYEPSAFEIFVSFGREMSFRPAKLKEGTLVIVENLFRNFPARLAFLKNTKTETLKNLELIRSLMITNPHLQFEVVVDGKKNYHWEGGTPHHLLSYLFEIDPSLLREVELSQPPLRIHLILSDRRRTFSHTRYIFILVNRRLLRDEKLSKIFCGILRQYYGPLGYPLGILHIQLPSHLVDFNVHPAKWEVRFRREGDVVKAIETAVKELLHRGTIDYSRKETNTSSGDEVLRVREDIPLDYFSKDQSRKNNASVYEQIELKDFPSTLSGRLLGIFQEIYALFERDRELFLIDLHALAERVIYEELKKNDRPLETMPLLLPAVIKLTPEMMEDLEEKLKLLNHFGFEVEIFGEDGIIVRAVPQDLRDFTREIIEDFLANPWTGPDKARDNLRKNLACRLAKKRGDHFSQEENLYLIKRLFRDSLETCPHGRPIYFKLSLEEIEKRLKRRQ